jgi:hypothetical protein
MSKNMPTCECDGDGDGLLTAPAVLPPANQVDIDCHGRQGNRLSAIGAGERHCFEAQWYPGCYNTTHGWMDGHDGCIELEIHQHEGKHV